MKREDLRIKFKEKGLTYECISSRELKILEHMLIVELSNYKYKDKNAYFTMELARRTIKDGTKDLIGFIGSNKYVYFKVKGIINPRGDIEPFVHFEKREAISFNNDGFIGFAGWADNKNIQPFLRAFDKWIDKIVKQ